MDLTSKEMQVHADGLKSAMVDRLLTYRADPEPRMRKPLQFSAASGDFSLEETSFKTKRFFAGKQKVQLGKFYCAEDGFYLFSFDKWNPSVDEYMVVAILHFLRELNRPWEKELDDFFSENKDPLPVCEVPSTQMPEGSP